MIEIALPVSGKSQRFIDAGTVDEAGFGCCRGAVVGDFFDLQHNVFSIVDIVDGFADGVTIETVDDLLFDPPAEGVVFESDDAAIGAVGAAYFDQAVFRIPCLGPGFTVLLAAGELVAVVVVAVSELAPFRHLMGGVVLVGVLRGVLDRGAGFAVTDVVIGETLAINAGLGVGDAVEIIVAVGGGGAVFDSLGAVADLVVFGIADSKEIGTSGCVAVVDPCSG